ncbi:hypothetical protein ACFFLS_11710 [Flavobacterium procerum]|uniref:Lipoprotein n=1 Tax=Flavobacterium procerum TaxID=1455569 RepID=A0ABV6BQI5_9FLAO
MDKIMVKYCFFLFLLILSCKERKELSVENYLITNRMFNFQIEYSNTFKQRVTIMQQNDCKIFIYHDMESGKNYSLKILNNHNIIYRGVQIKKVDSKFFKINNSSFDLTKYYFEDKKDYRRDSYLFINNENGIVFTESLNWGTMAEYDIKKFNKIHKLIALKQLGFKDGEFELEYANRNYKPIKN